MTTFSRRSAARRPRREVPRASYDGVRPYAAWLATIARNALVDRARAEAKHKNVAGVDDLGDFADASTQDPTWRIEHEQLMRVVNRVRAELGEPDASIYRLRVEQGMSFSQTAKALGLTEVVTFGELQSDFARDKVLDADKAFAVEGWRTAATVTGVGAVVTGVAGAALYLWSMSLDRGALVAGPPSPNGPPRQGASPDAGGRP